MNTKSCKQRINSEYHHEMTRIKQALKNENMTRQYEEGILEFAPKIEYTIKVLLSWGGPSDGFNLRVEPTKWGYEIVSASYFFQDWYDGAQKEVKESDLELIKQLFGSYLELIDFE